MANVNPTEPQSSNHYEDRTSKAVKSVLVEIGEILGCFFCKDAATAGIYTTRHTLSLHDALPISRAQSSYSPSASTAPTPKPAAARPDPRIGLKAGWFNAAQAAWNMRLVSNTPPTPDFINRNDPNDFRFINSDLTIRGNHRSE